MLTRKFKFLLMTISLVGFAHSGKGLKLVGADEKKEPNTGRVQYPAKPMPPPGFVPPQPPPDLPPFVVQSETDPLQRKFALEQRLVGVWIGEGPCVGSTIFDAEGRYHQYGYGPGGGDFESGLWTIDWKELPPTLVLTPLSSKDEKGTGYLLIKLNDKHLDFRWDQREESRIQEHRRGTESDDVAIRIKILDSAVQRYLGNEKHGAGVKLPPNLQTLVDTKILPSTRSLCDPWGGDFQYDVSGKNNKGQKPDIWTETKDKKIIGNWLEAR